MKEPIGITINGDDYKGLLEGLTEIKVGKKLGAYRHTGAFCESTDTVAITAEDKNGTKWKLIKNKICIVATTSLCCSLFVLSCVALGGSFTLGVSTFTITSVSTSCLFIFVCAATSAFRENLGNSLFILTLIFGALGFFYGLSL